MNNVIVKELYIYPIKSLAGISIQSAVTEEMGFENDRRWMLIDDSGQFISQRKHPVLSQFQPKISDNKIEISFQEQTHQFFIDENLNKIISVQVWDDESQVYEVNQSTSRWFSDCLGLECKLVKIIKSGDRKHRNKATNISFNVSLADGYPYLLLGSESLNLLNQKLEEKITVARFRPNIVVVSKTAHEEDCYTTFWIGNAEFKNMKPCGRCIMVNNNPTNGVVKKEPLKTLSSYRKVDNSILFGTNVVCVKNGVIRVGDALIF